MIKVIVEDSTLTVHIVLWLKKVLPFKKKTDFTLKFIFYKVRPLL